MNVDERILLQLTRMNKTLEMIGHTLEAILDEIPRDPMGKLAREMTREMNRRESPLDEDKNG